MEKKDLNDLVGVLLKLIEPHQQQSLSFNEVAGLVALVDLLGILNLMNSGAALSGLSSEANPIQEALNSVLNQGGKGNIKTPADLMGLLGKNPALVASLMNLLMSSKGGTNPAMEKTTEKPPAEDSPPQQQARESRLRSS
ncbi:MAG: hypothetical protein GX039_04600 [Clostridia bacterium]|nr:hypothetical protein [Clostridia bacterium]